MARNTHVLTKSNIFMFMFMFILCTLNHLLHIPLEHVPRATWDWRYNDYCLCVVQQLAMSTNKMSHSCVLRDMNAD